VATEIDSLPPNECRDRPAHVIALFTEYRNAKRFEFANDIVAKNINQMLSKPTVAPYVPKGGKCASDKTLSWAEKGSGDFYVAQCVMPAKGALFLMKFELDVPAGACLSDASIQSEVNSNMCKTLPAYPRQYLHTKIQTFECKVGNLPPPGQAPTFRNTPQAQVLDAGLFNRLVNAGIDISDMAEEKDGWIRVIGRRSDLIKVAGLSLHPSEVEDVIVAMSDVVDVIVSSEENAIIGTTVVATV
jgi:hypothetical protein